MENGNEVERKRWKKVPSEVLEVKFMVRFMLSLGKIKDVGGFKRIEDKTKNKTQ